MERGKFIQQLSEWKILHDYAFTYPLYCSVCDVVMNEDNKFYWFFDTEDNTIIVLHKNCLNVQETRQVPCFECGILLNMDSEEGSPSFYGKSLCYFCQDRIFASEDSNETT